MPQIRGDEEVQPVDEGQDIPSLNAEAGDALANTGVSTVSSGAPGDAKRRALEPSEAAGSDSIRQSASLQVGHLLCIISRLYFRLQFIWASFWLWLEALKHCTF